MATIESRLDDYSILISLTFITIVLLTIPNTIEKNGTYLSISSIAIIESENSDDERFVTSEYF